jgi:hypothetical protein
MSDPDVGSEPLCPITLAIIISSSTAYLCTSFLSPNTNTAAKKHRNADQNLQPICNHFAHGALFMRAGNIRERADGRRPGCSHPADRMQRGWGSVNRYRALAASTSGHELGCSITRIAVLRECDEAQDRARDSRSRKASIG